jgi:hypothetical protein
MEAGCQAFLLLLVNLWAQERVSAFQQKQFEILLHFLPSFLSSFLPSFLSSSSHSFKQ